MNGFVLKLTLSVLTLLPVDMAASEPLDPTADIVTSTPDFECGKSSLTPLLPTLRRIGAQADSLLSDSSLRSVRIVAGTSADGPRLLNESLALSRASAIASWFAGHTEVPDSMMTTSVRVAGWQDVDTLIRSENLTSPYRAVVLQTIGRGESRAATQRALKGIEDGKAWEWLAGDVLPKQRSATIDLVADKTFTTVINPDGESLTEIIEEPEPEAPATNIVVTEEPLDEWIRHLYIKTNIPAWGMLWTNVAVEVDLAPHLSFTLPVYYSGMNYFSRHTKFRTLALQPELRWWPKNDNTGFFAGAHFGLGWYNVAFGGDYRYQDHNRSTPAIGGGVAAGYRFHFCRNHRWQMEASLGFGIYRLDYDLFQNEINGLLVGRRQRTFYGLDQAAFTISYNFGIGSKKGGGR